ncbi:MAG: hypothetical protein ACK5LV_04440 [Lachnospirales bacterium]
MNCSCGNELDKSDKFCDECGEKNPAYCDSSNDTKEVKKSSYAKTDMYDKMTKSLNQSQARLNENKSNRELLEKIYIDNFEGNYELSRRNKKKSGPNKHRLLYVFFFVLVLLVSIAYLAYDYRDKNDVNVSIVNADSYPFVTIQVLKNNDEPHNNVDLLIYQNDVINGNEIEYLGQGNYKVKLDSNHGVGEVVKLEVHYGIFSDTEKFVIEKDILTGIFASSTIITNENYPIVSILTDVNKEFLHTNFAESVSITVGEHTYKPLSCAFSSNNTVEFIFDLKNTDFSETLDFTYNLYGKEYPTSVTLNEIEN